MRLRSTIASELRATLAIALPLAAANLAQMLMGFTDTVMVGRLGGAALAAAGLGAALYFTVGVMFQGIVSAVTPLAAHALGAGDRAAAGRIAGAGLVLAALLSLPLMAAAARFDGLLRLLGYDAALAEGIGHFLHAILWGAPALLGFAVLRSLLAALSRTRPVTAILVLGLAANVGLNWVLIFGHLGVAPQGIAGSGYATAINQWLMFGGLALAMLVMPRLGAWRLLRGAGSGHAAEIARILRLGAPIGAMLGLEIGVFVTSGVLMGLLGPDALGAHQIVINCASLTFMVPLGVSQAATVRVAFERGAGRPRAARRAGFLALGIGVLFMGMAAIVLWTAPDAIVAVYLDSGDPANRGVVAIALRLIAVAALFQVVDGIQTIAAGALRGYEDVTRPMLLAALGYWGIGFLGGWLLAFPLGYGAVGLWWGLALGLAAVAALLALRLRRVAASAT